MWCFFHKWTKWTKTEKIMVYKDGDGVVRWTCPVYQRECERCGRPERKEFW